MTATPDSTSPPAPWANADSITVLRRLRLLSWFVLVLGVGSVVNAVVALALTGPAGIALSVSLTLSGIAAIGLSLVIRWSCTRQIANLSSDPASSQAT